MTITYKKINVYDQQIFYRESGSKDNPVLLLLHGFPSSSNMFRNLIPLLEQKFHVIAPDYVGFGQLSAPDSHIFDYVERQLDLIYDYHTNVALYPKFQKYIRQYQPKI